MPRYPPQGVLSQKPRFMSFPSMVNNLQANPPLSDLAYSSALLTEGNSRGVKIYPRELLMTNLQGIAFILTNH